MRCDCCGDDLHPTEIINGRCHSCCEVQRDWLFTQLEDERRADRYDEDGYIEDRSYSPRLTQFVLNRDLARLSYVKRSPAGS